MVIKHLSGWFQALFAVLILWSISNVFLGYTIRVWGVDPIVYSCVVFTSASLALLLFSGYGKLARETIRSIDTWGYGICLMLNYIVLLALLALITSTEATLLQSIAVPVSLMAGWFFIGRSVSALQIIGAVIISVGLYMVCADLDVENFGYTILLIIAMGIIQTIRTYVAEFHRPHKFATTQSTSIKDRSRVIALVMFIVSTLFFIAFLGLAFIMHFVNGVHIPGVPVLSDFFNPYTVIFGMIAGLLLIAPLRFFEFSATHAIKTENYLAVTSFAPAATWFWEYLTAPITNVDIHALGLNDAIACGLITIGGLVMALSRMKSAKNTNQDNSWEKYLTCHIQNLSRIADSREIVMDTLRHFNGDVHQSAAALKIPADIINVIILDDDRVLSFHDDELRRVSRHYRKNVTSRDALSGLLNRAGFTSEYNDKIASYDTACLLFIDLNKFKPVNDTYGHEAGDFILQQVGERLTNALPEESLSTRLGGDEFVIVFFGKKHTKRIDDYIKSIKTLLETPFHYNEHTITIGGSIGTSHYPKDANTLDGLMTFADEHMYREKSDR